MVLRSVPSPLCTPRSLFLHTFPHPHLPYPLTPFPFQRFPTPALPPHLYSPRCPSITPTTCLPTHLPPPFTGHGILRAFWLFWFLKGVDVGWLVSGGQVRVTGVVSSFAAATPYPPYNFTFVWFGSLRSFQFGVVRLNDHCWHGLCYGLLLVGSPFWLDERQTPTTLLYARWRSLVSCNLCLRVLCTGSPFCITTILCNRRGLSPWFIIRCCLSPAPCC